MAYLLLVNASKASHSDTIKLVIKGIHAFLNIDDEIKKKRI